MLGTLRLGDDAQTRLIHGACGVARAVKVTLGPRGRLVLLDDGSGRPRVTKGGATIAESIGFRDRYSEMGAALMREVARGTADAAGDGAATATTIAHSLLTEGFAAVAAGLAPLELGAAMETAIGRAIESVAASTRRLEGNATLRQVAAVAANGDTTIGDIIAAELMSAGADGLVLVEHGNAVEDAVERRIGMEFDQGYASRAFADAGDGEPRGHVRPIELVRPLILLCHGAIDRLDPWLSALDAALAARRPLLIVASDFGVEALAALAASRERGGLKVVPVKSSGFAGHRTDFLGDLAALTGGNVVMSPARGDTLANIDECLGRAERARITTSRTTVVGGGGSAETVEARCRWLRAAAARAPDRYDAEVLRRRLARLSSGVSTIRVGGATEVVRRERHERFESALNATRSAATRGVVVGGGVALYRAASAARQGAGGTPEFRAGGEIVARALREPLRQIAANAGAKTTDVLSRLDAADDPCLGFDAERLDCGNIASRGILDSAATVTAALRQAGSIATLVLTAGGIVLERREKALSRHPFACRCSEHDQARVPEDTFRSHHRALRASVGVPARGAH
jgi:chaperonin GroEL